MTPRARSTITAASIVSTVAFSTGLTPALADDPICDPSNCLTEGGTYVGITKAETSSLPPAPPRPPNLPPASPAPVFEYSLPLACPFNKPEGEDKGCTKAFDTCTKVPDATGPYVDIWRRLSTPAVDGGTPELGQWEHVGSTCWPNLVPNAASRPQLTLAMITAQWRRTPFAKPGISSQPVGGRTLTGLPTYFELIWPQAGFAPGEIDTTTLLGHRVRIKPTFKTNVFHFGDGGTLATSSSGGPYPDGDITHTYERTAKLSVHITTTYGGEYSVDGSAWAPIPGTVDIAGPDAALEVAAADNELVLN